MKTPRHPSFWVAQRFQCVRENSNLQLAVEQYLRLSAAKRRKNAAHGASRGYKWDTFKPRRGERRVLTHTLLALR